MLPLAGTTMAGPRFLGDVMLAGTGGVVTVFAVGAGVVPGGGGKAVAGGGERVGRGELSPDKSGAALVACAKASPDDVSNTRLIPLRLNLTYMGLSHA